MVVVVDDDDDVVVVVVVVVALVSTGSITSIFAANVAAVVGAPTTVIISVDVEESFTSVVASV